MVVTQDPPEPHHLESQALARAERRASAVFRQSGAMQDAGDERTCYQIYFEDWGSCCVVFEELPFKFLPLREESVPTDDLLKTPHVENRRLDELKEAGLVLGASSL